MRRGDDETKLGSKKTVDEDVCHRSLCFLIERFSSYLKNMFELLLKPGCISLDVEVGVLHGEVFCFGLQSLVRPRGVGEETKMYLLPQSPCVPWSDAR